MQYSAIASRSDEIHTRWSCSPETRQVFSTLPTVPEKMKGDVPVGQNAKAIVVREDSCMITTPETTISVFESDDADKEKGTLGWSRRLRRIYLRGMVIC